MNCEGFWNTMPELGETDCSHLLECPACTARMIRQRELHAGLRAVAASYHRSVAPDRLETRLLVAFRKQAGLPARPLSWVWPRSLAWTAAIAAMLLLGALLMRNIQPPVSGVAVPHTVELAAADPQGDFDGFISLPNSAGIATSETEDDVNLVRVAVPRSEIGRASCRE